MVDQGGYLAPLSSAQARLWFLHQMEGPSASYNIPFVIRLEGRLNVEAFRRALGDVVDRHEALRTLYPNQHGTGMQRILPAGSAPIPLELVDVEPGETALTEAVLACTRVAFDLATEVPVRWWLLRPGAGDQVLVIVMHHIATDGASFTPFFRDLTVAYRSRLAGAAPFGDKLELQYADYAAWEHEMLDELDQPGSLAATQAAYWRRQLADLPAELALPTRGRRTALGEYDAEQVDVAIPAATHAALVALARESGTTTYMTALTLFCAALVRVGSGTDLPIGCPTAGRTEEALEALVGFFVNTLVVRIDAAGDPSFRTLLHRVRATCLDAYENADLPFDKVVELINPVRVAERHPLTQVMLIVQNVAPPELDLPGVRAVPMEPPSISARFDLTLRLVETYTPDGAPNGIGGEMTYRRELFDRATAGALAGGLVRLAEAMAAGPDTPIGRPGLLDGPDSDRILHAWGAGQAGASPRTLADLFAEAVATHPDAVAVSHGDRTVTYRELASLTDRLAHRLIRAGIGAEDVVAVRTRRGLASVVALLGVAKAGAVHLPVDADYPPDRITAMLHDAAPKLVLDEESIELSPAAGPVETVRETDPVRPLLIDNAAYLVYTSGSTGRPKAVSVTHRGLTGLTRAHAAGPGARVLSFCSPSFDGYVGEVCLSLLTGAHLIIPSSAPLTGEELADFLDVHAITHAALTPAVLAGLPPRPLPALQTLMVAGDACSPELVRIWSVERRMINIYGPTENTVTTTQGIVLPDAGTTPIGSPIGGVRVFVLDHGLNPVPPGVAGELYAAGDGLARGYRHGASLTATRFVPCPFGKPGERMYRTGDLVRWRADGRLAFVGRGDRQIKVRGFRVEPGEIEAVLVAQNTVQQAVAVVREDRPGDQRLVLYVVPSRDAPTEFDVAAARESLADCLPTHMVPSAIVALAEIPLSPNGKVDLGALPPPPEPTGAAAVREPSSMREEAICGFFAETLGVERVGADDNFFELGGHSLLAARLMSRIRAAFGTDLGVRTLFDAPTPSAVARRLSGTGTPDDGLGVLLPLRGTGVEPPLFCIHPAAGISWVYSGLLGHLDPQIPVLGIQARGLYGAEEPPASFTAAVDDYLAIIRTVQPDGPYRLLGWSYGGVVAHAVATRLQATGHDVTLLALLDSIAVPPVHAGLTRAEAESALLESLGAEDPFADLTPERRARILDIFVRNSELGLQYIPGRFNGDLLFFTAAEGRADDDSAAASWRPWVTGEVRNHQVACVHGLMTRPESLANVGPVIAAALAAEAQAGRS
ncbi:non-ribosomal peptide synthetase [Krasilnikovia sp. MM14-A1259]|uniref:non-ribosomal peptide synthetase n=1 Tax=Krasilnikovia sp. MM14-A1259 TaxID=3373539 RepID=UPI00380F2357